MLRDFQKTAQKQAMKFMQSEMGRKLMNDKRVQAALMKAINRRAKLRQDMTSRVQKFAKDYKLVTREDVATLRRTIREMENSLMSLKSELEAARADLATTQEALAKKSGGSGSRKGPKAKPPQPE